MLGVKYEIIGLQSEGVKEDRKGEYQQRIDPKSGNYVTVKQLMNGALRSAARAMDTGCILKWTGKKEGVIRGVETKVNKKDAPESKDNKGAFE